MKSLTLMANIDGNRNIDFIMSPIGAYFSAFFPSFKGNRRLGLQLLQSYVLETTKSVKLYRNGCFYENVHAGIKKFGPKMEVNISTYLSSLKLAFIPFAYKKELSF